MSKRWHVYPHDPGRIAALERAAGIPAVMAQLLICRGLTDPEAVGEFLDPKLWALHDPELLPGCRSAAERHLDALSSARRIAVYGDYDVNGMTGTAILWRCLKLLRRRGALLRPAPRQRGLRAQRRGDPQTGGRRNRGVGHRRLRNRQWSRGHLARELGVELIVTDHHEPPSELPAAAAIVHPRLPHADRSRPYPFGDLSGSGVALKLAWKICQQASGSKRAAPRMRNFLLQAVGLAALGTVADVVPLVGENRVLVHHGLESLANAPNLGLATLIDVAKVAPRKGPTEKCGWRPKTWLFRSPPA